MTTEATKLSQDTVKFIEKIREKFNAIFLEIAKCPHNINDSAHHQAIAKFHECNFWLMYGLQLGAMADNQAKAVEKSIIDNAIVAEEA